MDLLVMEGTIEDIVFRNEANGYTVAKLHTEGEVITIVGNLPFANIGETVKVEGELIYHPSYGEQIEVSTLTPVIPSTTDGIEKYLSSGLIPYIGPKTAEKIVDRFQLDTLDIIQFNPERLKEIDGIGDKKLAKIVEAFEEQGELREVMVFLQGLDISPNYGMRIYKKYGRDTLGVIKENPYKLSEDIMGIGFKKADQIAEKMGISSNSPYRVQGGIKYVLHQSARDGHTFVPKEELMARTSELIEVEEGLIEEAIRDLAMAGTIHINNREGELLIYYTPFHVAENSVARKIVELSRVKLEDIDVDIDNLIKEIEGQEGIEFARKQREAIVESIDNGLVVITGGPGTGKTTIINAIIKIFEAEDLEVKLAAPTGRAAKRMTETTGMESKTIHRLLEYAYMEEGMAFGLDESNPLETDLLIIDEASMIDILLMNNLLKAVSPGTRLILVGDVDQLPSVGPGNVLGDIIASQVVKVVKLDEIFRQAEQSMIVVNAHRINGGEFPLLNRKNKDFFFINENNPRKILEIICQLCKERLPNYYGVDALADIQVLSPMKKGDCGTNALNKSLQETLNPKSPSKTEKRMGEELFRVGDKVMQIRNNYTLEWTMLGKTGGELKGEGIYNGDLGLIEDIDEEDNIVRVLFDGEKQVEYDFNQLDELQLSYASTVHKSQGSEFPVAIIPIHSGPPMLLTRNLLYTGITRASDLVVLVGLQRYLKNMIDNNRITQRYSSLDENIRKMLTVF